MLALVVRNFGLRGRGLFPSQLVLLGLLSLLLLLGSLGIFLLGLFSLLLLSLLLLQRVLLDLQADVGLSLLVGLLHLVAIFLLLILVLLGHLIDLLLGLLVLFDVCGGDLLRLCLSLESIGGCLRLGCFISCFIYHDLGLHAGFKLVLPDSLRGLFFDLFTPHGLTLELLSKLLDLFLVV